nr:MAG TPA: hypothetical protein [Bacteriophage sp.]
MDLSIFKVPLAPKLIRSPLAVLIEWKRKGTNNLLLSLIIISTLVSILDTNKAV